jgi:hypothetical protein
MLPWLSISSTIETSESHQFLIRYHHGITHIGLDGQSQLPLCQDPLHKIRMHVHARYCNSRHQYISCASLICVKQSLLSGVLDVLPRIFHFPVTGEKHSGICSCSISNRSPERIKITSMKLSISELGDEYLRIGASSEKR